MLGNVTVLSFGVTSLYIVVDVYMESLLLCIYVIILMARFQDFPDLKMLGGKY